MGSSRPPEKKAQSNLSTILTEFEAERFRHADNVIATATEVANQDDPVSRSWIRSLGYKLDPTSKATPTILTSRELTEARGSLDRVAAIASDELDRLFGTLRYAGYVVLLCNDSGVIVSHRGERDESDKYRFWGSWLGAVWSEELEGTNGIGTCLVEKRPITIHRSQHFRGRHIGLSCSGAPIFDHELRLIAVLDASSIYPNISESSHALAGALAVATARAIEERLFRDTFRSCRICAVRAETANDPGMLFAIDQDARIVGAHLGGREFLRSQNIELAQHPSFWSAFERDIKIFAGRGESDSAVRLKPNDGGMVRYALMTPPALIKGSKGAAHSDHHTRPRLDLLNRFEPVEYASQGGGGLSTLALKRVHQLIETNLGHDLSLTSMANAAGLSVHHFARVFKQTQGLTPHEFVMKSRIERSRQLLTSSDLSLAEIAASCGFADQSHFARTFRRFTGETPRSFRTSST